jgi:hypothetical protein
MTDGALSCLEVKFKTLIQDGASVSASWLLLGTAHRVQNAKFGISIFTFDLPDRNDGATTEVLDDNSLVVSALFSTMRR